MTGKGRITEDDYVRAHYVHLRPRRAIGVLVVVLVVFFTVGGAVMAYDALRTGEGVEQAVVVGLALLFTFLYFALFLPWRAKSTFRQYAAANDEFTLEVQSDGVRFESQRGQGTHFWGDIRKWREGKTMFLVYLSDAFFLIVPKHIFSDDRGINDLRSALEAHIGPAT